MVFHDFRTHRRHRSTSGYHMPRETYDAVPYDPRQVLLTGHFVMLHIGAVLVVVVFAVSGFGFRKFRF